VGDLVVTEADLQALGSALATALGDLEALQGALRRMDVSCVGAAPLIEAEKTFTSTRRADLTALGSAVTERRHEVAQVAPTMRTTDHRVASHAQHQAD